MIVKKSIVSKIINLPFEEWRDIKSYEGIYQVSNLGRVRSLNYRRTGKKKIIQPIILASGYVVVNLYKNNKHSMQYIHRLVAEAFIVNKSNEVNHIDEDKSNNNANNLEWCTREYNMNHGTIKERRIETRKATTKHRHDEMVREITLIAMIDPQTNKVVKLFKNIVEANEYFNKPINNSMIRQTLNGKWATAYGYRWMRFTFNYSYK